MDVLVFVVDSADRLRLPWARQELHKLLDKDPDLPVVVVANKQVRATGGRLRPVGLDAQMPGQERPHWGGPGHDLARLAESLSPPFPPVLCPHPVCLPLCLPGICHPGDMSKIIFEYPLDARCGFE